MNKDYFSYANEIASLLRKKNIDTEVYSDPNKNLGKQLTYANKKGNPVACIIGDNEFKDQTVTLKNLMAKKGDNNQTIIKKENLINEVKKYI
jgi:histidyl-tRNA synthetase